MAECYPSREEVEGYRVPLEPGERHLLDVLLDHLGDKYEVYVQPFLNGERPDLVVVRPDAGVLLIEVKDWDLTHYAVDDEGRWRLKKNGAVKRSPAAQVEGYKQNLYDLHIEHLHQRTITNSSTFGLVRCAVYFHNATEDETRRTCGNPKYTIVLGRDSLGEKGIRRLLNRARLDRPSGLFDDELYHSFRRHLRPPVHNPDEGRVITYTPKQQALTMSESGVARKVRGVAGCGKTLVLARRAVNAHARTGRRVLVLTFNISLRNYIRDRISEVREPFRWDAFYITHYHQFFKTEANNHGLEYGNLLAAANKSDFFEEVEEEIERYDAIFVDEVQDYEEVWIRTLRRYFLEEDGEFVVFGDEKQNVYGRKMGEDKRPNTTIPGAWNKLNESHRLNGRIVGLAQDFQRTFFDGYDPDEDVEVMQGDLFAEPPRVCYVAQPDNGARFELIRSVLVSWDLHPNDVTILAAHVEPLRMLDRCFREAGQRTVTTFETEEERAALAKQHGEGSWEFEVAVDKLRRNRKFQFNPNPGTLKLSTIHSFKGWEIHTLVLLLDEESELEDGAEFAEDELVYTALTRARHDLVVIGSGGGTYDDFFAARCDALEVPTSSGVTPNHARETIRSSLPDGHPFIPFLRKRVTVEEAEREMEEHREWAARLLGTPHSEKGDPVSQRPSNDGALTGTESHAHDIDFGSIDPWEPDPKPKPRSFQEEWEAFKPDLRPGDELWYYFAPQENWDALCGREGYVVIRDGAVVRDLERDIN